MAEKNLDSLTDFGIESTTEIGNTELLDDFFASDGGGEPDEVKPSDEKKPEEKKQEEVKKPERKEEKNKSEDVLADFLEQEDVEEEEDVVAEKKPEQKQEEKSEEEEQPEETEETTFQALNNDLIKLGIFGEDEEGEEIKSPDQFVEKFKQEMQKGASQIIDNFIGKFGQDYQRAFEAIFVKGVNPKDYLKTYTETVDFATLDMTKEENQEMVIRQSLLNNEWEEEDINSEIDRLKNYGDLEQTATKHHKVLVRESAKKLQQMEQQAQQLQQQKEAVRTEFINNVTTTLQEKLKTKEFDGIPLNNSLANKVQDFLLTIKYTNNNGDMLTDFDKMIIDLKKPENHATKVKVALLLKTLEKDPTLKTIQRSGVSKEANELFTHVKKTTSSAKKTQKNNEPARWWQ